MVSFEIKMWWAVLFTGLICIGLAVAGRQRHWGLVAILSGFLIAGLFAVLTEMLWWMSA